MEDRAVVDAQTLGVIQVVETLEPHLQILSDVADKATCPPLVEVGDVVVVHFRSHNNNATQCSANALEYHQDIFELECMFFVWI